MTGKEITLIPNIFQLQKKITGVRIKTDKRETKKTGKGEEKSRVGILS